MQLVRSARTARSREPSTSRASWPAPYRDLGPRARPQPTWPRRGHGPSGGRPPATSRGAAWCRRDGQGPVLRGGVYLPDRRAGRSFSVADEEAFAIAGRDHKRPGRLSTCLAERQSQNRRIFSQLRVTSMSPPAVNAGTMPPLVKPPRTASALSTRASQTRTRRSVATNAITSPEGCQAMEFPLLTVSLRASRERRAPVARSRTSTPRPVETANRSPPGLTAITVDDVPVTLAISREGPPAIRSRTRMEPSERWTRSWFSGEKPAETTCAPPPGREEGFDPPARRGRTQHGERPETDRRDSSRASFHREKRSYGRSQRRPRSGAR